MTPALFLVILYLLQFWRKEEANIQPMVLESLRTSKIFISSHL